MHLRITASILDEFQNETLVQHLALIEQQGSQLQPVNHLCWQINALPLSLTAPHCPKQEHVQQALLDELSAEHIISSTEQEFRHR